MRESNNDTYICTKLRIYNWLCDRGYEPYDKIRDVNNPKFFVWLFNKTNDLMECVSNYYDRDYFKCK